MMNIVLITSMVCVPNKPFTYISTRSVFTREERYKQLQKTIVSVRDKIPDAFIFVVECGIFNAEEKRYFEENCDYMLNLIEDTETVEDTSSIYKGLGERIQTLKALEYIVKYKDFDNLFKLSGRYYYNDKFDLMQYENGKMNFYKIHGNVHNINTCGYKLKKQHVNKFITYLKTTRQSAIIDFKGSYEKYIARFVSENLNDIKFITKTGISGQVSVCGSTYNN